MGDLKISKLDAARRQLQTAITLWFTGGDPVAIHALAFAAYEIIHTVSKKRDPKRPELLFDATFIKKEKRSEFNALMKKHANFFKHADRDGEAVIEFNPEASQYFVVFALAGLDACGERHNVEEMAFSWWMNIHKPHLLAEEAQKLIADQIPNETIRLIKTMAKAEFFELFNAVYHAQRR
jgi:hypothetical protein